jgi:3-oxoadipate enol-lactonase
VTVNIDSHIVVGRDGTHLAVAERGSGDAVLFLPGLGYSSWCWKNQVGPVSEFAKVMLLDNRGVGLSDKPEGPYSIEQMADDAYEVLRQRGAGAAHVVGTSMGGYIALTLALRHPEAVRSLILIATTSGGPGSQGVPPKTLAAWASAVTLGPAGFARATMPLSYGPGWVRENHDEFEELLLMRIEANTPTASWRSQFDACATYLKAGLPDGPITQPTVIVHGTEDRVVPYSNVGVLSARLPQASVVTIEGAGHLCWIERADVVNDVIRGAVRGEAA